MKRRGMEKKGVVLGFQLVLFAAVLVWILGFLLVGVLVFPQFEDLIYFYGIPNGATYWFLVGWFWVTVVASAALVATKGFRSIGKWSQDDDDSS